MSEEVAIYLSRDEALILFEWIATLDSKDNPTFQDPAEEKVVWKIEGVLEKLLVEPFSPNYRVLVEQARKRVNASYEE